MRDFWILYRLYWYLVKTADKKSWEIINWGY